MSRLIFGRRPAYGSGGSALGGRGLQIGIAVVIALVAVIGYCSRKVFNPVTGEDQYISLTMDDEIALGLQAAPEMAAQFGGLDPDPQMQALVDEIGSRIISRSSASEMDYQYEFHVLNDPETVNAFALPGGQIFITEGLLTRLENEDQIAGVLGHEVGHVVARHGAEHLAKAGLLQGITGAVIVGAYDPENPTASQASAAMAAMVGQLISLKYGRDDELESDRLGVRFLFESGYDPRAMIGVMEILAEASGGGQSVEFFQTHPNPERRIERIEEAIREYENRRE
jgi:predicted Zn-dependent protease